MNVFRNDASINPISDKTQRTDTEGDLPERVGLSQQDSAEVALMTPLSAGPTITTPNDGSVRNKSVPGAVVLGLPSDYRLVLAASPDLMSKVAWLRILGDRRSAASLGLFVVLFFGLTLTLLAIVEALRLAMPEAGALLDAAMVLTLIVMLISPVVLAAMLGISLGQAIRQPKAQRRPDLERQWLLKRGSQIVGKLRLLPEALRLRLVWVSLQADHRGQGIGTAFVRAVLQAEDLPCRVKLPSDSALTSFFQGCGFQRSPEAQHRLSESHGRASWRKPPKIWMNCDPKSF